MFLNITEEMLADENIDIIYVATPHSMHYENMKQAVNAGRESISYVKKRSQNAAQLEEVLELAEEKRCGSQESNDNFTYAFV